jgi:hypothetical protein
MYYVCEWVKPGSNIDQIMSFIRKSKSWDDIGVLIPLYTPSEEIKMIYEDVAYWAKASVSAIPEEITIEEELRSLRRELQSVGGCVREAELLNSKSEKVTDGLCELAESLVV